MRRPPDIRRRPTISSSKSTTERIELRFSSSASPDQNPSPEVIFSPICTVQAVKSIYYIHSRWVLIQMRKIHQKAMFKFTNMRPNISFLFFQKSLLWDRFWGRAGTTTAFIRWTTCSSRAVDRFCHLTRPNRARIDWRAGDLVWWGGLGSCRCHRWGGGSASGMWWHVSIFLRKIPYVVWNS